jgi:hypothetical protein
MSKQEIELAVTSYLYCAPAWRSVSTAEHTPKKKGQEYIKKR